VAQGKGDQKRNANEKDKGGLSIDERPKVGNDKTRERCGEQGRAQRGKRPRKMSNLHRAGKSSKWGKKTGKETKREGRGTEPSPDVAGLGVFIWPSQPCREGLR